MKKTFEGAKMIYIGQQKLGSSGVGGAARVENLINLFKDMGFNIYLIAYSTLPNKLGIDHEIIDESIRMTAINIPYNYPKFLKFLTIIPILFYVLKSAPQCDIIFADFIGLITSIPALLSKKLFHKPIILDYIDLKLDFVPHAIYKYMVRNADCTFAISPYLFKLAKDDYGTDNVLYVPNSIDTNLFKMDLDERDVIRKELGIKTDETVIGYAGSFWYVEGVPILLKAFRNLLNKNKNIKLAIMGKVLMTRNDDNISKLVEDMNLCQNVILIPLKPHKVVPKYLSAFDVLCCPKIDCEINRAASPVKVPEYLSMGLPTVASAVGGILDVIDNEVNGILVEPDNVNDLENKLEWILLNPDRAKKLGQNGREKILNAYSCNAIKRVIARSIADVFSKRN